MSVQIETEQTQKSGGRRRNRNRNQKMKRDEPNSQHEAPLTDGTTTVAEQSNESGIPGKEESVTEDTDICFICAENVKYYSVSECNHRTCHVCALRLRALYKKKECTFCNLEVRLQMELP